MTEQQRRFYLVNNGWGVNYGDYEFENRESLYATLGPDHRRQYRVEGYDHPFKFGLPNFTQTPRLKVAIKNKPLDLYGGGSPWFVSTAARELFLAIDPDGFEFVRCETHAAPRHNLEDYWMAGVKRVVEDFDEERSVFERHDMVELTTYERFYNPFIGPLYELSIPSLPADAHAFWLKIYRTHPIFDGELVDAIRKAKLRGFGFTPLQWPRKDEMTDLLKHITAQYWYKKVKADG